MLALKQLRLGIRVYVVSGETQRGLDMTSVGHCGGVQSGTEMVENMIHSLVMRPCMHT